MNRNARRCLNRIVGGVVAIAVAIFPVFSVAVSQTATPLTETRGVWLTNVSSDVLFVPGAVTRALDELSQHHFTTVYPVVWNRGQTFYPSSVSQRETGRSQDVLLALMQDGEDILHRIIKEGHQQNLNVLAWFEYGFMAPKNSELVKRHPDWITQHRDRSENLQEDELKSELLDNPFTIQQVWLNPLHPEVQNFLLSLIVEVILNYNVDGIQFDDNFGLPVELGYDPFTIELYRQEHWGYPPPNNPYNSEWVRWRAAKITDFMQRIFQVVKFIKPDCPISLAAHSQSFAYRHYLQDWLTWVESGWIDELILQVYHDRLYRFHQELLISTVWYARNFTRVEIGILSGTMKRPISISEVEERVQIARELGFNGFAFFYWESLWGSVIPDSPEKRRQVFHSLFAPDN